MRSIPYGRQDIAQEDVDAVVETLTSDFITQGPRIPDFEKAVAAKVGARYGVAVNSATSALHIACLALEVGPGDMVWTSPITFVASANAARLCGGDVDFVDIDPRTFNMSAERLAEKLESTRKHGRRLPKVVIPVHMCGQSADMAAIHALGREYGFRIVEDAAHAVGGSYDGAYVGDCRYCDIAVFSFHPVKIITTAEGGVATTNSGELALRMALHRNHGVTRDPDWMTHAPEGPWYYQQVALGLNYRMTDLQAALGLSQLARLDAYVARRHTLAGRYDTAFADLPLTTPWRDPKAHSAYHLYVVQVRGGGAERLAVFNELRAAGIGVNVHYIPVHLQPYYRALGFGDGDFPAAEAYYAGAISLPLYATLARGDQGRVVAAVEEAVAG